MTPIWTAVLADGDHSVRRELHEILQRHPGFKLIGDATNGPDAIELIEKHRPDLAVLGLRLPGLGGLDVLRALPPRRWPEVLFCAESADRSQRAIEELGLDCLVGPGQEARALAMLERVAERLEAADPTLRERIGGVLAATDRGRFVERIPVRHGGSVEIVELEEVDWIGAAGNYVELHCDGRRHLYRSALSSLMDRLDPGRFVRIHRSAVVNVGRVRELEPTPQGDYKLRLDTGAQLRLSRRFRQALDRIVPRP